MSSEPDSEEPISRETQIRLTEYNALREEILNKMESQRQFLSLAVIGIGTLFLASVQNPNHNTGAILMLGYPLVSLFLAAGWEFHGRRIRQIGVYIRDHIEKPLRDANNKRIMSWENTPLPSSAEYLAPLGIFVGSQIFAIIFGIYLTGLPPQALVRGNPLSRIPIAVTVMLIVGITSVIATLFTIRKTKRQAVPDE